MRHSTAQDPVLTLILSHMGFPARLVEALVRTKE